MSENKPELIQETQPEQGNNCTTEKRVTNISINKLRVIITNKKNSSWVDDLHIHDKLNSLNRVYH